MRYEIIPLPNQQLSLQIDGIERSRWHFGSDAPRPFFYPVQSLVGASLTRIGHPGAPDHDHHRSVWFAHHKLLGIDFWSENTDARITQSEWLAYQDGDDAASFAVTLDWLDGHNPEPLVQQQLIATFAEHDSQSWWLELQSTFVPIAESIEFQQTNFGFLAVRLSKSISAHFGTGHLTGADKRTGEKELFGRSNRWMDYSGELQKTLPDSKRRTVTAGITYFDHPGNSHHPAKWHVRDDGWMGASACRDSSLITTRQQPLELRYLLSIHDGPLEHSAAEAMFQKWANQPRKRVVKSSKPYIRNEIVDDAR